MITYIYTLECPIKHEVFYVGKTKNIKERFKSHCKGGKRVSKKLGNYIKFLKKNNTKPIMSILDYTVDEDWSWLEKYWISQFKAWGFNLLNITEGGEKSYHYNHTDETKKKISEMQKNRTLDRKWCDNISKGKKNVKFSDEHKHNLSLSHQGKKPNNIKSVYMLDDNFKIIKKYQTITSALRELNVNNSNGSISEVCKGKLKKAFGYYWCYVNDYDNLDVNKFKNNKIKSIIKIDPNSEEIVEKYVSLKEAANKNNCHYTSISHVCNNKCGSVNGFIFLFENEYDLNIIKLIKETIRRKKDGSFWNN